MTSTRNFDYDDTVRRFRAACALRGIDPVNGATEYQVVHLMGDRRRAERRQASRKGEPRWWMRHELWLYDDDSPQHSDTEADALWGLFRESYLLTVLRVVRARRRWRMAKSLRELHECQRRGKRK